MICFNFVFTYFTYILHISFSLNESLKNHQYFSTLWSQPQTRSPETSNWFKKWLIKILFQLSQHWIRCFVICWDLKRCLKMRPWNNSATPTTLAPPISPPVILLFSDTSARLLSCTNQKWSPAAVLNEH